MLGRMTNQGLVIVGGGPAGLSAARAFREAGGTGQVRILSGDEHPPYNRPPLSKDFLRGESELDELPLEGPGFYAANGIELSLRHHVAELDLASRELVLQDGGRLGFETLVLATGSDPAVLPVDGGDHPDLFVLRSRVQGQLLREAAASAKTVVVVGSGFIGCEAAVSLAMRGLEVTMVSAETEPQAARLGDEVADRIAGWLREAGVVFVGGSPVQSIVGGRAVRLEDGSTRTGDLVLVAGGAVPQGGLAERAGLETADGRVVVDERMRTSVPGVLAAGDVARATNATLGRRISVEHWGEALRMGEVAGAEAAGKPDPWAEVPGFWSEIGDHTVKYAAWGDGHDAIRLVDHGDGGFTARYGREGVLVGVLTHEADDDYERGQELVEKGAPFEG
jgi:3-phenylpropionate/trans-cinnamate dioxygenase ferredoxin reductase component